MSAAPATRAHGLRARAQGRASAGYTVIEVLMSLSVLAVGVIGVFSMEKITVSSNVHAKNLAMATHIAQSWLGELEAEATLWDASRTSLSRTTFLAAATGVPAWFRPTYSAGALFGPEFDELGNPVVQNGRFCVDLRVSPLNGQPAEDEGLGMRRVEVRVYWLRDSMVLTPAVTVPAFPCQMLPVQVSLQGGSSLFHFVYLSGAVRQVVP